MIFFFSIDAKIKIKKNPAARTCHGHSRTEINTVPHEHKTPPYGGVGVVTSPAGRRGRELVRRRPGCRGGQTHACARRRRAAGRSAAGEVSMPRQAGKEVAAGACTSTERAGQGVPLGCLPRARSLDLDVSIFRPVRPPPLAAARAGQETPPVEIQRLLSKRDKRQATNVASTYCSSVIVLV